MKDIKLVIFDLDGLLFDTEKLGIEAWEFAINQIGLNISREGLISRIGRKLIDTRKIIIESVDGEFDFEERLEVVKNYMLNYAKKHGMPIKKGVLELLSYLEETNVSRCVATSRGKNSAGEFLKLANIYNRFDYIVTGEMIERGKPEPDTFLYASKQLNINPSECLVLEDSFNGVIAGVRAGMKTIMIPDMIPATKEIEEVIYAKCDSLLDVIELMK
ncbi:MAG: HAD family phosphatase [Oscillospiraceae bacterium]|nr:HAD family phosphatase [Oscillospiraceae bacterium]